MIDFRYHVVSLVSVFLALAVGIVLGAGPLRAGIGNTLTGQVQVLRGDRDALRVRVATADAAQANRDEFLTAVTPALTGGQLAGRAVALVRLPGVEDAAVEPLVDTLTGSGAVVSSQLEVTGAWTDPQRAAFRGGLATQLRTSVPGLPAAEGTERQLAALLARALVSAGPVGPDELDAPARTVLGGLSGADLIEVDGEVEALADAVIVLAPALPVEPGGGQATPAPQESTLDAYVGLATALDAGSEGGVLAGPASSATAGGVVAALRGDDTATTAVSTVDTAGTPMGVIAAVLALREQLADGVGQYGFGDGAGSPLPELPAGTGP